MIIGHIGELTAWIEANLPALDPDRFHPWTSGTAVPGARTARIEVRVHSTALPVRKLGVDLFAQPLTDQTAT